MNREPWWFGSPLWWQRLIAVVLLIVVMMLLFSIAGWALDLSTGYGSAQSRSATWLADHTGQLGDWRSSATRDLFGYVPIYLVGGSIAYFFATRSPWPSITLLALGALADAVETVRFRGTLDDLIAGRPATELLERTSTTALATGLKWGFILASIISFGCSVLLRKR